MGNPRPDEVITRDSIASALMSTFRRENAGRSNVRFEVHIGEIIVSAHVHNGQVDVSTEPIEKPDLVFETGPGMRQLMAQEVTAEQAVKNKIVRVVSGDAKDLKRFAEMFQI